MNSPAMSKERLRSIIRSHKRWDIIFGIVGLLAMSVGILTLVALFVQMVADGFPRLGGHLRQRGALQEVEDREAGGKPGRAGGGQDVVRPADVVADGLGGVLAQEDGTGMGDLAGQALGIGGAKLKVFGGDAVVVGDDGAGGADRPTGPRTGVGGRRRRAGLEDRS